MVKNPPCNADDGDLIPGQGTKIPHAVEQLSPHAGTTEPVCHNYWRPRALRPAHHRIFVLQRKILCNAMMILQGATKTRGSQINKTFFMLLSEARNLPSFPKVEMALNYLLFAVCCLVVQSYPTLCNPPGSSIHGISQTRILERVASSFSRGSSQPRDRTRVSCIDRQILYHWAT